MTDTNQPARFCPSLSRRTSPAVRHASPARRLLIAMSLLPVALLAQPAASDEVVKLADIETDAGELDLYSVLPSRPTSTVFGTDRAVQDTPRSITVIESSLTDLYGIRTVNDFVAVTAGSFTGNYFGVPGALDVRGERADNFFRGFRRIENRGNFPTPIASTDFVEIIKGPPPPVYGGGKVGGILNFIPKTAKSKTAKFIEKPQGIASVTLGTYDKKIASVEYGTPFSLFGKRSGAYGFIQTEDSENYYNNIYNKGTLAQLAVDTELSDSVLLEYGVMAQWADLNQSLGWNRVTQELIDTNGGRYLSGRPALNLDTNGNGYLSPSEISAYSLEQFAFADPFPYGALTANQQAAFRLDPTTVKYTSIGHNTVQVEPGDFSQTDALTLYFDITKTFTSDFNVKNQSFYDSMNHTKYSSYGFTADYVAMAFENKTTANLKLTPSEHTVLDTIFGVSFRYSDGDERESRGRGYQVLDRRDISVGATGNDRFEGAHTGTGNVPYNWRQTGDFSDFGIFGLIDATFFEKLGVILSGRWDRYEATTNGTDLASVFQEVSASDSAFTYNASVNYKLPAGLSTYVTHAESRYLELGQGGMIDRLNLAQGTWLQDSEISEIGLKGSLLKNRLYATLAYYEQEKTAFNSQAGTFDTYESEGTELEARFAPTKTLSFTAAATWQKTLLKNPPFFLGVPPGALGLDPTLVYGGRFVSTGQVLGVQTPIEAPTPQKVFSLGTTYTSPKGWGGSFGGTYVSSFYSGYAQQIKLPEYTTYRAAIFYNTGPWSFRINANNIFDEKSYAPQFLFWDTFISPSQGPTAELTVTYKW
ncbi:TonB-dependent siderophore receptor [Nibricoccus aquaticus]|nr:TonB-dependent receptor [Nibricoccus aquaticus]